MKCFKLYNTDSPSLTWDEARMFCQNLKGQSRLASVRTSDENEFLQNKLINISFPPEREIWIGAFSRFGSWRWSNGSKLGV